jgi:hypothetical protein
MNIKGFWEQIENANKIAGRGAEAQVLTSSLCDIGALEAAAWRGIFNEYVFISRGCIQFRKAAFIVNGHNTEIGYERFRGWSVIQGKDAFFGVMKNAESIARLNLDINISVNKDILNLADKAITFYLAFIQKGFLEREALRKEAKDIVISPEDKETIDAEVSSFISPEGSEENLVLDEIEKEFPLLTEKVNEAIKAGRHGQDKEIVDFWLSQIPAERLVLLDQWESEGKNNLIAKLVQVVPPQERTFELLHHLARAFCNTDRTMQAYEVITTIQEKAEIESRSALKETYAHAMKNLKV